MHKIEIRRPSNQDIERLKHFFSLVIKDTFTKEGIEHLKNEMEEEFESKIEILNHDLASNGADRYFYIASVQDQVVGSIEYGPANKIIHDCTAGKWKDLVEIGTVYVHPDYQGQGLGSLLLNIMFIALQNKGIEEFCLDSGYKHAQQVWLNKFGKPDYLLKDFWGEGIDHMLWRRRIEEMSIMFKI